MAEITEREALSLYNQGKESWVLEGFKGNEVIDVKYFDSNPLKEEEG